MSSHCGIYNVTFEQPKCPTVGVKTSGPSIGWKWGRSKGERVKFKAALSLGHPVCICTALRAGASLSHMPGTLTCFVPV